MSNYISYQTAHYDWAFGGKEGEVWMLYRPAGIGPWKEFAFTADTESQAERKADEFEDLVHGPDYDATDEPRWIGGHGPKTDSGFDKEPT